MLEEMEVEKYRDLFGKGEAHDSIILAAWVCFLGVGTTFVWKKKKKDLHTCLKM